MPFSFSITNSLSPFSNLLSILKEELTIDLALDPDPRSIIGAKDALPSSSELPSISLTLSANYFTVKNRYGF